jgi:soluble lytic murein transglycosylase-like protein
MSLDLSPSGRARRRACAAVLLSPCAALLSQRAHAGAQIEEPLADSVRLALNAAVSDSKLVWESTAPPELPFRDIDEKLAYLRWLTEMSHRLRKRMPDYETRVHFLGTLRYAAARQRLDPSLVLGLVQVESGFKRYAASRVGACGFMQVMPFWARLIGDGDASRLFHVSTNLAFGCVILRHYLDREKGDMYMALGRYNGSRGRPEYPNAVFASQKLWAYKPAA